MGLLDSNQDLATSLGNISTTLGLIGNPQQYAVKQQATENQAQADALKADNIRKAAAQKAIAAQVQNGVTDPSTILSTAAAADPSYIRDYANYYAERAKIQASNPLAAAFSDWNQNPAMQQGGSASGYQGPAQVPQAQTPPAQGPTITDEGTAQQQPSSDQWTLQPETSDDKRNYAFLNTKVPPQYRNLIRQISNGDESVGNADSLRSNGLLALASAFDPSLSKTDLASRQATAKAFSQTGKGGQFYTSANTATKHLASVVTAALDLNNGSVPAVNYVKNSVISGLGDDRPTNLSSIVQTVAPELAKAAAGGGDTGEAERMGQASSFGEDASPSQLLGAAAGKVDLIQSKANEMGNAYQKDMGRAPKQSISPENVQTLNDIKTLHALSQQGKLSAPEAQPIISRLRSVAGGTAQAVPSGPKTIKFGDLK